MRAGEVIPEALLGSRPFWGCGGVGGPRSEVGGLLRHLRLFVFFFFIQGVK